MIAPTARRRKGPAALAEVIHIRQDGIAFALGSAIVTGSLTQS
jgi:hypothetical protein